MPSSPLKASALPRKKFFLEMFTRDISLVDCILDLIDNAIDGLIRSRKLDLDANQLLRVSAPEPNFRKAQIDVTYSRESFNISDNCGGIPLEDAKNQVFNFGQVHDTGPIDAMQFGAYGIGLKRAIFKIGDHFEMVSRTMKDGFRVKVDVKQWSEKDTSLEDRTFPLDRLDRVHSFDECGTTIEITKISPDIHGLFIDTTVESSLHRTIAQTYGPFLAKFVDIRLNNVLVNATPIPLGQSRDLKPAIESWDDDGVRVTLIAGLAAKGDAEEWRSELAGWYVLCNGRVIVNADKSDLTGWGAGILPQFHSSKGRGFIGIASFSSREPLKLPWTTTKRSLNRESRVFRMVRDRMATVARPVYTYLESFYKSKSDYSPEERKAMTSTEQADVGDVASGPNSPFQVKKRRRRSTQKTTTNVQYSVESSDLDRIKERLRKPNMAASQIGRYTFDYFMEQEGLR